MKVVGTVWNTLKGGWNRKEVRGNKNFKQRGKLAQGVGALKKGGWNPPIQAICLFGSLHSHVNGQVHLSIPKVIDFIGSAISQNWSEVAMLIFCIWEDIHRSSKLIQTLQVVQVSSKHDSWKLEIESVLSEGLVNVWNGFLSFKIFL